MNGLPKFRIFALLFASFLVGCGTDDVDAPEGVPSPPAPHETASETAPPAAEDDPSLSEFFSAELHEVDVPSPGQLRLEVAGEVHEVELGVCWTSDGDVEERHESETTWETDDGRHFHLVTRRLVRSDEFFWGRPQGYEVDQVLIRAHDGDGHFELQDRYGASGLQVWRDGPGDAPVLGQGTGDLPALRIVQDDGAESFRVSAVGELGELDDYEPNEYGSPVTGPFTLAMHCE